MFQLADKYKTTWMHPRSKHWHTINFVIVHQCNLQGVRITCAMRGAECWIDHSLVRAIFNLYIAPQYSKELKAVGASFNVAKLNHLCCLHHLHDALEEKLSGENPLEGSSMKKWSQFKHMVTNTATAVLGPKTLSHQDWFDKNDESISAALDAKNKAYIEWQRDPLSTSNKDKFKDLQSKVQTELWKMQDLWWQKKAEEVQPQHQNSSSTP